MYIETEVQPRFCDTDAAGHINNTAVAEWLEVGRMKFMMTCYPKREHFMLRRVEIDYDRELTHLVPALVRTGVEKVGTRSVTLRQEIWQRDICCVRAIAVDCYIDKKSRQGAPIPQHLLDIYPAYLFVEPATDGESRYGESRYGESHYGEPHYGESR